MSQPQQLAYTAFVTFWYRVRMVLLSLALLPLSILFLVIGEGDVEAWAVSWQWCRSCVRVIRECVIA